MVQHTAKLKALLSQCKEWCKEGVTGFLNATLDTLAPGARALQQIDSGKVITPRMELMFEGVGRRSFSFTFAFIPKSAEEAKSIEKIIQAFKENMMPEYVNDSRREMKIPNTFDITYMYQNTENKFINKISSCFLKSMMLLMVEIVLLHIDPIRWFSSTTKKYNYISFY